MSIVIVLAMLVGTQATAPSSATPPAVGIKSTATRKGEKLICEKQEMTGSRLGQRSVCLTEADWRTFRNQMRTDVERAQNTGIGTDGH